MDGNWTLDTVEDRPLAVRVEWTRSVWSGKSFPVDHCLSSTTAPGVRMDPREGSADLPAGPGEPELDEDLHGGEPGVGQVGASTGSECSHHRISRAPARCPTWRANWSAISEASCLDNASSRKDLAGQFVSCVDPYDLDTVRVTTRQVMLTGSSSSTSIRNAPSPPQGGRQVQRPLSRSPRQRSGKRPPGAGVPSSK